MNAFDNNFITFDNANNTYDESGTPRAGISTFDQTGAGTFDSTLITMDQENPVLSWDSNIISLDSTAHTLDETL